MLKYFFACSIALLSSVFSFQNISFVWEETPNFQSSKKIFLDAFIKCYGDVPLEKLQKSSKEELYSWLDATFDETYSDHQNNKDQLWLTVKLEGEDIGFIVIDVSKHPEEIYLVQFSVMPTFQRKGIGTAVIDTLIKEFPQCKKLAVVTRWVNIESVNFYTKYGFTKSAYSHEGYSPKLYGGFEYSPKKHLQN